LNASAVLRIAPKRSHQNRIGSFYLIGATCLGAAAWRLGGIAWLLFWPAGACLMVAIVYRTRSPQLFRNQEGVMSWPAALLLAPYMAAAWLNSRCWTRGQPTAHEIVPGIWLGRLPTRSERDRLRIASVVDLAPELPINARGIVCRRIPMLDLVVPELADLEAAVNAIEALQTIRPTLVCCALGYSRSAMTIAAWLLASQIAPSVDSAITLIRTHRQQIVLSAAHRARLEEWASERCCSPNV